MPLLLSFWVGSRLSRGGELHRSLSSGKFALWEVKQNQLVSRPVVKPGILHSEMVFLFGFFLFVFLSNLKEPLKKVLSNFHKELHRPQNLGQ